MSARRSPNRTSAGERVLLLGGCCALLPGAVAGIRDALGTVGVVNIDGHLDLYDETTSPTGEIADVPIAALLGLGVAAMQPALSPPVLRVEDVALVGYRDADEAPAKRVRDAGRNRDSLEHGMFTR